MSTFGFIPAPSNTGCLPPNWRAGSIAFSALQSSATHSGPIFRNVFRSEYRKRRREVEDAAGSYADTLTSLPNQTSSLEMDEFRKALDLLPPDQRDCTGGAAGAAPAKPKLSYAE